ncbi:MAG: class I SAM-dependent methyltransferase [Alphaproteobacteria bacterium]
MKILERQCPSCSSQDYKILPYGPIDWPMAECNHCAMVYLKKAPDCSELFENLAWEKTTQIEEKRRQKEFGWSRKISRLTRKRLHILPRKQVKDLIEKYAKPGNVMDVGSGPGDHVLALPEKYSPYGIEVSKNLARQGQKNFEKRGGEIINLDALGGLKQCPDDKFSAIIMRSFLEHDIHPFPILKECVRTLNKGGIVIIKVPNYGSINRMVRGKKWCGMRFPDHVNYFTPKSLSQMVLNAGLSIKRFGFIDKLPTSDNMWLIAQKD